MKPAVRLLTEMGVLQQLKDQQKVRGVRVFLRGNGSRDFEYPQDEPSYGLVVPRVYLDHAICQRATAAGAELWQQTRATKLIRANKIVTGVEVERNNQTRQLYSRVVVLADGALSGLARQAGIVQHIQEDFGFAIRGYFDHVKGLGEMLEFYLPLTDPSDGCVLPSYGWVFPTGSSTANIGLGLFRRKQHTNVRQLFVRFLEELRRQDPRFVKANLTGVWKGAPLRFDFAPERCIGSGLLLVGDAAGLINPFTGEGISYALESGKLAAQVIDGKLRLGASGPPDLSEYATLLQQKFSSDFEIGSQSVARSELMWHLLEAVFQNDRPFFELCRRSAASPDVRNVIQAPSNFRDNPTF
jgi:geranylgeranyl reductase family protein